MGYAVGMIISSCQSAATSEIAKRCWARVCLLSCTIASTRPLPSPYSRSQGRYGSHASDVAWVIGVRGGLQFWRPQSHKMPNDLLSPHFCHLLLTATQGCAPLRPLLVKALGHITGNVLLAGPQWTEMRCEQFSHRLDLPQERSQLHFLGRGKGILGRVTFLGVAADVTMHIVKW